MPMQFANAWMLYALWLVPVLGLAWLMLYQRRSRALECFLSSSMRQKLCPSPQPHRFYWQGSCLLAGCLLALIAAARPQWGLREETVIQRGRDLIIALDVSRSMLAQDAHPSRFQRAKTDIQDLLRELRGDRAALVTFRGRAVQLCPLTTDYGYLEQILNDATLESAPRGETDIGDAIHKALAAFESDQGSHQAIVLISDGEDLAGKARKAAEEAKKKGVVIFTVGLGDPKGAKIPSPVKKNDFMMYQGKEVVTKLEHDTLKAIAEITGGAYVPVGVANVKLGALYRDHLSKIAAQDIEESIQRRYIDRYQWFLLPGVILLLITAGLSRGRLARRVRRLNGENSISLSATQNLKSILVGLLVLLLAGSITTNAAAAVTNLPAPTVSAPSNATISKVSNVTAAPAKPTVKIPPGREGARLAQGLYLQGKYREAAETYLQAAQDSVRQLRDHLTYNAACALYRAGQYQAAADKFAEVASREEAQAAAAQYNAGCAWFRLSEQAISGTESNRNYAARPLMLERSGQAFQRALRLDPDQSSARDNLATAVQTLPEAREQAKIHALMEKYGKAPPFQITDDMLTCQRKLIEDLTSVMTNATPARIEMMESLSERQRQNTDLLIPLRASLATAMAAMPALSSNAPANPQQQMAAIQEHLEALKNVMNQSREDLRNLENNAYGSAATAESGIYTFWKAVAPFPPLLREDMRRQTNAIDGTRSATSMSAQATDTVCQDILAQQEEAIQLTQLFTDRFTQAVPPEGLKPPPSTASGMSPTGLSGKPPSSAGSTNAPEDESITPEKRANILNLAHEAKACQEQASKLLSDLPTEAAPQAGSKLKDSLVEQQNAYNLLLAIEKLLPKNKNNQQQQQDQQQQQKEKQDKQDQKKEDQQQQQDQQKQEQKKEESQPQEQPPPEQQPPQEQQPQPAAEDQQKQKDKEMTPEQARALLDKAKQREKDHQEERMRDRYIPPSPVEKDW